MLKIIVKCIKSLNCCTLRRSLSKDVYDKCNKIFMYLEILKENYKNYKRIK